MRNAVTSFIIFIIGAYLISQNYRSPFELWTISSPANAWSSALYALPVAPLSIKVPLITLSIASFGLWSHSTTAINFVDVTSIYWIILIVSVNMLPGAKHKQLAILCLDGLFASAMTTVLLLKQESAVLNYYQNNLVPITGTIMVICTVNTAAYYGKARVYLLGTGMIVVGFGFKLLTIYGGQYWGTCIFHTTTAAGIAVLTSNRLTLEAAKNEVFVRMDLV